MVNIVETERTELPKINKDDVVEPQEFICGDQSPWAGGLLRWHVLHDRISQKSNGLKNSPVNYFIQDVDTPWKQNGIPRVEIKRGWADYWNLAVRSPWSLEVPGMTMTDDLHKLAQSVKSPRGLEFLAGPSTTETILSRNQDSTLLEMVKTMLRTEIAWAKNLGEYMGISDSLYKADGWGKVINSSNSIREIAENIASAHDLTGLGSTVGFFEDKGALLVEQCGFKMYWSVDNRGNRTEASATSRGVLVPKGKILPLEMAAHGLILGFTGLNYLKELVQNRDRYVPSLTLRFTEIKFEWELDTDPLEAIHEAYRLKKRKRDELKGTTSQLVELKPEEQEVIRSYWRGRPTSITYDILGGRLNPVIRYYAV